MSNETHVFQCVDCGARLRGWETSSHLCGQCERGVSGSLFPVPSGPGKTLCRTCGRPLRFRKDGIYVHREIGRKGVVKGIDPSQTGK
jgi:hypothetical protein